MPKLSRDKSVDLHPTLADLLALLSDVLAAEPHSFTPRTLRRWLSKVRWVRYWLRRRAEPDAASLSDHALDAIVVAEAKRVDPGVTISVGSLWRWRQRWNAPGPGGLAAGPWGLLDTWKAHPSTPR